METSAHAGGIRASTIYRWWVLSGGNRYQTQLSPFSGSLSPPSVRSCRVEATLEHERSINTQSHVATEGREFSLFSSLVESSEFHFVHLFASLYRKRHPYE